jgi:hypothetical protein
VAFAQESHTFASDRKLFVISYEPGIQPLAINRMHSWVVHVETADGTPVADASVSLVGGMPDHDHGLPTLPQSTQYLGDGDYLIEGMKFHMNGRWIITISIDADGSSDTVNFELQL